MQYERQTEVLEAKLDVAVRLMKKYDNRDCGCVPICVCHDCEELKHLRQEFKDVLKRIEEIK